MTCECYKLLLTGGKCMYCRTVEFNAVWLGQGSTHRLPEPALAGTFKRPQLIEDEADV